MSVILKYLFRIFTKHTILYKRIFYKIKHVKIKYTYSVWILFIESNVPFARDCMLLSYRDKRLKLCKSLNVSFLIHEISFAFNNNNCRDVNPLKTPAGKSFILLP